MNAKSMRTWLFALATLGLVSVLLFSSWSPARVALAHDATHSSSFSYSTEGSDNTVLAPMRSTDSSDAKAAITIYFTPIGGAEQQFGGAKATRNDTKGLWVEDEDAYAFTTSTRFRARFTTYDGSGTVTWYYDRYLYP